VIVTGISLVNDPEVPMKSKVVVSSGARYEAVQYKVTVALPLAGTVTGLEDADAETPGGNALTLNVTEPLNPFTLVMVAVLYSV
jgi:hypothetical protein